MEHDGAGDAAKAIVRQARLTREARREGTSENMMTEADADGPALKVISGDGRMIRSTQDHADHKSAGARPPRAHGRDGNRSRTRLTSRPRSRSCGSTTSTMNSRIIGTASRRFVAQSTTTSASSRRPGCIGRQTEHDGAGDVSRRFRRRPNMAAAKASMTRRVSRVVLELPPLMTG